VLAFLGRHGRLAVAGIDLSDERNIHPSLNICLSKLAAGEAGNGVWLYE